MVQIKKKLREIFLMMPSTKMAQILLLNQDRGHNRPRYGITLNHIFYTTIGPNS